jgi:hypothetical protein
METLVHVERLIREAEDLIRAHVDREFREAPDRFGMSRTNPIVGSGFTRLDPVEDQKRVAYKALLAQAWLASQMPDGLTLPVHPDEIEDMRWKGGVRSVVGFFARSALSRSYNFVEHPSFDEFARGLMACVYAPDLVRDDEDLRRRFPPKLLNGLGPGCRWLPPKEHQELMESVRRHELRQGRNRNVVLGLTGKHTG